MCLKKVVVLTTFFSIVIPPPTRIIVHKMVGYEISPYKQTKWVKNVMRNLFKVEFWSPNKYFLNPL